MSKTLNITFLILLFAINGYSQGLYLPKGESGGMISFYYGRATEGFIHNTLFSYSFNGKLTTGVAFQQATYAVTGTDWDYFSIPLFYHMLKPEQEGDMTFDLLGSYSFGNFNNPDYDTGSWERIGHEIELGMRIGNRFIDSEQFQTYPKLTLEYFWSIITFDDKIENETESFTEEGTRLTVSFDMIFPFEKDKHIMLTPILRYNREIFIYGGGIAFFWGKLH